MRRAPSWISAFVVAVTAVGVAAPGPASARPMKRPIPEAFSPISVSFISNSTGWALGTARCGSTRCTTLVRTTNRGKNWTDLAAPQAALPQKIAFANAKDGYLLTGPGPTADMTTPAGHELFVTKDGGARWTQLHPAGGFPVDVATTHSKVFVVSAPTSGTNKLLSGEVGTKSLHSLGSVKGDAVTVRASHAYVYPPQAANYVAKTNVISVWNGSHLATRTMPCVNDWTNVLATRSGSIALFCADQPGVGIQGKNAWTSTDGGRTWSRTHRHPPQDGYLGSAAATRAGLFYTGGRSGLIVSRNHGGSWRSKEDAIGDANGFASIAFTDAKDGIAVEQSAQRHQPLLLTGDAGQHWHKVWIGH